MALFRSHRGRRAAATAVVVLVLLLVPSEVQLSGGALVPVTLRQAVEASDLVLRGTCLGTRRARVHLDRAQLPQGPGVLRPGEEALDFEVEEIGLRVTAVLRSPAGGPGPRDELWLVDPHAYAFGSIGGLADVATIAVPTYQGGREDLARQGAGIVVFAESAAHRRARGQRTAGLDERWWLVAARAYDEARVAPSVRAMLERR